MNEPMFNVSTPVRSLDYTENFENTRDPLWAIALQLRRIADILVDGDSRVEDAIDKLQGELSEKLKTIADVIDDK